MHFLRWQNDCLRILSLVTNWRGSWIFQLIFILVVICHYNIIDGRLIFGRRCFIGNCDLGTKCKLGCHVVVLCIFFLIWIFTMPANIRGGATNSVSTIGNSCCLIMLSLQLLLDLIYERILFAKHVLLGWVLILFLCSLDCFIFSNNNTLSRASLQFFKFLFPFGNLNRCLWSCILRVRVLTNHVELA